MPLHDLLNTLEGVKKTGPSRYIARCPSHQDKRPSLTITEKDDGVVLIKCWAGCGAAEILRAVGLEFSALYPPRDDAKGHQYPRTKRPWNPADLLRIMAFEAWLVAIAASRMNNGETPSDADRARIHIAATRLERAAEAARGASNG